MRQSYYLRQRKANGLISVIYIDPISGDRTERATGTNDEKKANAIAQDWLSNGIPDCPVTNNFSKTITFCDFLYQFWDFENSEYFREQETMGKEPEPEHAMEMQKTVDRYYRMFFKNMLLSQINEVNLQNFIVHLKIDRKLAASTVNSARNVAIKALRFAKRKKIIKSFDFDNILRAGGKPKKRGVLEKHEANELFYNHIWPNEKSRLINLLSYHTGCRLSELRCLKVCDIQKNKIYIRNSWSGKKNREKSLKNKDKLKIVPIISSLYEEIMLYVQNNNFNNLDGLLFPGKKPEIPYDSVQIRKCLYKMLEKIGINEKVRKERNIVFHSYRNRLAKTLSEKGVNKSIAMKILGIKTERIFMGYASGIDNETLFQMTDAIEMVNQPESRKEPILFKSVV